MSLKTSIDHLPKEKQTELQAIAGILIGNFSDVEMVILFGSYATGKWVEDFYEEKGIKYEYKSDYDLLIILGNNEKASNESFTQRIVDSVYDLDLSTPVSPICHSIDFVNKKISTGSYFFNEIREQGIAIYDSGKVNLANKRPLNIAEIKTNAENDFHYWFKNANEFFIDYQNAFNRDSFNQAAFMLHQATERYYNTIQLVFTGYKPKTHDIQSLGHKVANLDSRFAVVFPRKTSQENENFILLKKAYVDARYNKDYKISEESLKYLSSRVEILKNLTEEICKEKINSFK